MSSSALRLLDLYQTLLAGATVSKATFAQKYEVNLRTIQRDLADIRDFITTNQLDLVLKYQADTKEYHFEGSNMSFGKADILALIKILLASRAFNSTETTKMCRLLLALLPTDEEKNELTRIIKNELSNYVPLQHKKVLLSPLWDFSRYIERKQTLDILYTNQQGEQFDRTIIPQAIIFSDYYFYIVSYDVKKEQARFYRLDRILSWEPATTKISLTHKDRFEDGLLRKHIQYMTPGNLIKIKFEFTGILEAALDRFPNSKVLTQKENFAVLEVETMDNGAMMWLLSQGARVKVLAPQAFKAKMHQEIAKMLANYQ